MAMMPGRIVMNSRAPSKTEGMINTPVLQSLQQISSNRLDKPVPPSVSRYR
jgi:hypothetical protein